MKIWISMAMIFFCISCDDFSHKKVDPDSTHTKNIFFVDPRDLAELKKSALSGNDNALSRVISYYMLSSKDADRDTEIIYWSELGARKGIKEHKIIYLNLVDINTGKCEEIVQITRIGNDLDETEMNEIMRDNIFVKNCLFER